MHKVAIKVTLDVFTLFYDELYGDSFYRAVKTISGPSAVKSCYM